MHRRYTVQEFIDAVRSCRSIRAVLQRVGLVPAGGNYQAAKKLIGDLGLDTSHFLGQAILRGQTHAYKTRPLDEVLVRRKAENTWRLRNRLLREGLKARRCERCGLAEWLGRPIPLELHHVDGDSHNNVLSNIELLCPNCHALTGNYRGRKKRRCRDCTAGT